MYQKLRNLITVHPDVTSLVSKYAQNVKEKLMKPRGKTYARCGLSAKNVEGGGGAGAAPPRAD